MWFRVIVDVVVPLIPSDTTRVAILGRRRARADEGRIVIAVFILKRGWVRQGLRLGIHVSALVARRIADTLVSRNRYATTSPFVVVTLLLGVFSSRLLVVVEINTLPANETSDEPSTAQVFRIDNAALSQLDTLACPVYPRKVEDKRSLYGAPDPASGIDVFDLVDTACDPVKDIHEPVCAEGNEVEGIDDGGNGGLAKQQELRDDADRLENLGEDPEHLQMLALKRETQPRYTCFQGVAVADDPFLEDEVPEWSNDDAA